MMAPGLYDKDLQMFRDRPREINLNKLLFLRWLAEQGKLEHETFGEPTGECLQDAARFATTARPG
jgi:hypothetical protein